MISETHQLFQGPRTRTGSRDIDSKKVYFSTDTAFIFQLHNSNNFGEYTTSISQWKLKEIKTKLKRQEISKQLALESLSKDEAERLLSEVKDIDDLVRKFK